MFEYDRTDDRLTLIRRGTRWLSNGVGDGYASAHAAHNLTVPEGFDRTDLATYAAERLGKTPTGPTLLTRVRQTYARGARYGPIEAVATAGMSNPAMLPIPGRSAEASSVDSEEGFEPGTVNVFVGTTRSLPNGGLVGLLATAVEAKTATLLELAGCTGTTSDAVAVGCATGGELATFAGSGTKIGNATRVCVRDAVVAALEARYGGSPPSPEEATYGIETTGKGALFRP